MLKYEKAFQDLKNTFTKVPILVYFTLGQQLYFKTDSLDYINTNILF